MNRRLILAVLLTTAAFAADDKKTLPNQAGNAKLSQIGRAHV